MVWLMCKDFEAWRFVLGSRILKKEIAGQVMQKMTPP